MTENLKELFDRAVETSVPSIVLKNASDQPLVVATPDAVTLRSTKALLDEFREHPEHVRDKALLTTAEAFSAYLQRYRKPHTAIFVSDEPGSPSMVGVIDFHEPFTGATEERAELPRPGWQHHTGTYRFPLSDAFKAWSTAAKAGFMSQAQFAELLQDRQYDIENPPLDWMQLPREELDIVLELLNLHDDRGADLPATGDEDRDAEDEARYIPQSALAKLRKLKIGTVETVAALARGIEVSTDAKATSTYDPKTGAQSIAFSEQHTEHAAGRADRKIRVPDLFFVYVPVFEGEPRRLLPVRLMYRIKGGNVLWAAQLMDAPRMVRAAVKATATRVQQETSLPLFYGKPTQ